MFLLLACAQDAGLKTYNSPPSATILTPTSGEAFWEYEPITFTAKVSDNATAASDLILVWSGGASGVLAGEQTITEGLVTLHVAEGFSAGDWGVSLQVTDEDGESVVAGVAFVVTENLAPNVTLLSPAEGAVYGEDASIPVSAFVTDADAGSNEELALTWSVAGGPAYPNTSGYAEFTLSDLGVGSHELSVTVTDTAGDSDSALVHFSVSDSDVDGDGYSADDCDDSDAAIHPGAEELCDTLDNDCDGETDEAGGVSWYADTDADGYGGGGAVFACSQPSGYAAVSGDCDDASASVNPAAGETCNEIDDDCDGATDEDGGTDWYLDADGDGYGSTSVTACEAPAGYVAGDGDCDDSDAEFNPGASESCDDPTDYNCDGSTGYADADADGLPACEDCDDTRALSDEECNGLDDDCDGEVDEDSAIDALVWYVDRDADGYGVASAFTLACEAPSGYADNTDDCDDADDGIHPGADETCDLEDEDCDGVVDNDSIDVETWYLDTDGDGYGTTATVEACEEPAGYAWLDGDCDDADAAYNPAAAESCDDPEDYNCDGSTGYSDADGDGLAACEDCDDTRALTDESCNDLDDDCDGEVDEEGGTDWYLDADGDGYGSDALTACDAPSGYVVLDGDCDDSDGGVNPDAEETCDDEDDDCDGDVDEAGGSDWYLDADGDGYGDGGEVQACDEPVGYSALDGDCDDSDAAYNPGASETCDDPADYNCDGSTSYADADGDGLAACEDCDDTRELGDESCNDLDDDCDGSVDEDVGSEWYADGDDDGYGAGAATVACDAPVGMVAGDGDCDDADADTFPGAAEGESGSECMNDDDGDGYGDEVASGSVAAGTDCDDGDDSVHPGATEAADGIDSDCDGLDEVCGSATLDVPSEYATIQDAIDAACDGDTVDVAAGTYVENIDFSGKEITVHGAGTEVTTIDGDYNGTSVVTMDAGTLSGIRVTNGDAEQGGGILILGDAAVSDVAVSQNAGKYGGGIYAAAGGDLILEGMSIDENTAEYYGAVFLWADGSSSMELSDLEFFANVSTVGHAPIYVRSVGSSSVIDMRAVTIKDHDCATDVAQIGGVNSGSASISDVIATHNASTGSVLHFDSEHGEVEVGRVLAYGNEGASIVRISDRSFGGGTKLDHAAVVGGSGTALEVYSDNGEISVSHVAVSNTTGAGVAGDAAYLDDVTISYTDVHGNSGGDYSVVPDPTGTDGNLSVDPEFMLYSADLGSDRWDLHLCPGSPLIDAGDPSILDPDGSYSDIGAYGGPDADFDYYDDADGDTMYDGWEDSLGLDSAADDSASDLDGDGLTNVDEFNLCVDASDTDTDDDGLSDYDEVLVWSMDPLDSDTDDDGTDDYDELAADDDGDGYSGFDDCDDEDADVSPAASESCNGVDDDCDDIEDDGFPDTDGDGTGDCADTNYAAALEGGGTCSSYPFHGLAAGGAEFVDVFDSSYTVEGWFYFPSYGDRDYGVDIAGVVFMRVRAPGYFSQGAGGLGSSELGGASIATGDWVHMAFSSDASGHWYSFLDGALVNSGTSAAVLTATDNKPYFGYSSEGYGNGYMDAVRVSDTQRYTASFTPDARPEADSSTYALWTFDEGSGTTVYDYSGNGFDLDWSSCTKFSWTSGAY